jgi:hypothetical protein
MLLRSLCIALSSTVLLAQNYSPVPFGVAEGPDNNVFPFGYTSTPFRYSQIHDDVPLMVIFGMAFRHNFSVTTSPGYSVTMDAWMSTAVTASSGMSTTFDNNHGPDKTQVIINHTYTLPPSNPNNLPGQFVLDYPFDVPFVFLGAPASLCWEVQITARTNTGNIIHDSVSGNISTSTTGPTNPQMVIGRFGTGCLSTGMGSPMLATPVQSISWPGGTATMTTNGSNLLPGGIVLFSTGASKDSYLGIPLPFTLPGTSCTVYNDQIVGTVAIASPTGTSSNAIPFVPLPIYNGLTFFTQIWGLDPAANPFGITFSNAAQHHIVAPYTVPGPIHRVYELGSLGPVGSTESYNYGLVTKFY